MKPRKKSMPKVFKKIFVLFILSRLHFKNPRKITIFYIYYRSYYPLVFQLANYCFGIDKCYGSR